MDISEIYLVDFESSMIDAWNQKFENVDIVKPKRCDYFDIQADAMVSPANSFGIMDGGLDLAIRYELGHEIEKTVQDEIRKTFHGELPIGNAIIVKTGNFKWPHLIVAPTMRIPMDVSDSLNAYLSFRAILNTIKVHNLRGINNKINSVLCPGLATGVGQMSPLKSAHQMRLAFDSISGPARTPLPQSIFSQHESLISNGT